MWIGQAQVTSVLLGRLGERETMALAGGVAGGKSLPSEILDRIIEHTDGIPLCVEELTKALLESSFLQEVSGQFILSGPMPSLAIPSSLHDSLMARLDRLGPVKEVAQIGAAHRARVHLRHREGGYEPPGRSVGRRAGPTGRSGIDIPPRRCAADVVRLQACARAGRGLWHAAARPPPGASCQHRQSARRAGRATPETGRVCRRTVGSPRTPLAQGRGVGRKPSPTRWRRRNGHATSMRVQKQSITTGKRSNWSSACPPRPNAAASTSRSLCRSFSYRAGGGKRKRKRACCTISTWR